MTGTGISPICHRDKKPFHVPTQCPLLAEMNLKLVPLSAAPAPAPPPPPAAPANLHVCVAAAVKTSAGCSGSSTAPSGLMAALSVGNNAEGDYDSGDDFHWDGDEFGAEYTPELNSVALYSPSCSHVSVDVSCCLCPRYAVPTTSTSRGLSGPSQVAVFFICLSDRRPPPGQLFRRGGHGCDRSYDPRQNVLCQIQVGYRTIRPYGQ